MNQSDRAEKAQIYVDYLVTVKPNRRTGSKGNKKAIQFFGETISSFGFTIDIKPFETLDYTSNKPNLYTKDHKFDIHVSSYSLPCDITTNLEVVKTLPELESCFCSGKILLLKDEICKEQLMPKNFVFYNPEHHQKIISLIETKKPAAIITATKRNPPAVGAIYPYPLIEDGDFNIPNTYCTEQVGNEIESCKNESFTLQIQAKRISTMASNVIAIKNPDAKEKIIICAHIDAYADSPGASDNASGVAVLLLLAELLQSYPGPMGIEIIAFNGEDHYSAGGQMDFLKRYEDQLECVKCVINIDDVGYKKGKIAYSFYSCSDEITQGIEYILKKYPDLVNGKQWYQGDHMIFVQRQIPCLAFTSEKVDEMMETITHTQKDVPALLDFHKLVALSIALHEVILLY